ncbi:S8 family serine peptidase, partial [Streptomyces sp. NPDC058964]|uniref:S8 family serine peptidase n=1 Tax=Streptomyces sp. NPDC058964 TaxID=3346681 RepID=UPI0036838C2C
MQAPQSRYRRAMAIPVGMAMATALAFLPNVTASAADVTTTAAGDSPSLSYVVNVPPGHGTSAHVQKAIAEAGGTVVISYDRIGVIVVHSSNPDFARTIRAVPWVDSAGATRNAPLPAQSTTDVGTPKVLSAGQVADAQAADGQDPLEPLQWDLPAIKADKAHEKTLGSRDVTVAVIDTGVDDTHPDIAPNFDRYASANCVSGKPDTADGAWRPSAAESPHGTHVAGEIAGARNGVGITGVAPGVKVAGIKVATTAGYFYTEAVVCGFMWAAEHDVDVTNNSYYTDPWYFNCKNDPDQKALVEAVSRAARYAEKKGAVNVAAAGNENYDLSSDEITDPSSPNDTTPGDRVVDPSECLDIPTQLPGVVTVASTGAKGLKSSFSNHGLGVIDIAAPGGDSTAYQAPEPPAT